MKQPKAMSRLIENPHFYNLVQRLAGVDLVDLRIRRLILASGLEHAAVVLDVGGGTGLGRKLWPKECNYFCLDSDVSKLRVFQADHPSDCAIVSDGTEAAIGTGTVDAVMCKAVAHHLSDDIIGGLVGECRRVLRAEGRLVFLEPLQVPPRPASRMLWSIDRGSHPRTADRLIALLEPAFEVERVVQFSVIHRYLLLVGAPRKS